MYLLFITFWPDIGSIIRVFGSEDDRVDPFGRNCGSVDNVDDSDDGIVVSFCLFDGLIIYSVSSYNDAINYFWLSWYLCCYCW